jgi:protein phosphatase/serine/threonine-protein phosphatase Stp1
MIPRLTDWAMTHVGAVRRHNEDALLARADLGLWVVADGAGGHQAGELASGMIVSALDQIEPGLSATELLNAVRARLAQTHRALRAEAQARGTDTMIASTVIALILRDQHFACLWAGDSRAYLLRGGALTQINRDHSLVQELVELGRITPEEAEHHPQSNVITRAIGIDTDEVEIDKVIGAIEPGDRFLLCSDGLSKTLSETEIEALLGAPRGASPAELLIGAALARHVNDNVTVVAVEIAAD